MKAPLRPIQKDKRAFYPALLLGSTYTVLATARALGRFGVPVYCPADSLGYIASSRRIQKHSPELLSLPEFTSLRAYLEKSSLPHAVLIPCSDHWVREIASLPEDLKARFPSSSPSTEVISILLNKARLATFLQEHHFPAPLTLVLHSEEDISRWPEDRFENAFLKPCDSQRFHALYKRKAFRVHSRPEAETLFRMTTEQGIAMVLQEYLPGPASRHYFIDGFVDRHAAVRALFARHRLRMYPPDFGDSTYLRSIPLSDLDGTAERLCELLSALRYRGIFSAEFDHDLRDGQFKLLEINARPWWMLSSATDCGVNVAIQAYRDALGLPVETVNSYRMGVGWVNLGNDARAAWPLIRSRSLSFGALIWSWLTSRKAIFRWSDPLPSLTILKLRLKWLPHRLLRPSGAGKNNAAKSTAPYQNAR